MIIVCSPRGPGSPIYIVASQVVTWRRVPGGYTEVELVGNRFLTVEDSPEVLEQKMYAALEPK